MLCEVKKTNHCDTGNGEVCNGRGTCMGGFCSCTAPYIGETCSDMSVAGKSDPTNQGSQSIETVKTMEKEEKAENDRVKSLFRSLNGKSFRSLNGTADIFQAGGGLQNKLMKEGIVMTSVEQKQGELSNHLAQTNQTVEKSTETKAMTNLTANMSQVAVPKETSDDASSVMDLGSPVTSPLMAMGFIKAGSHRSIADALREAQKSSMIQSATAWVNGGGEATVMAQKEMAEKEMAKKEASKTSDSMITSA